MIDRKGWFARNNQKGRQKIALTVEWRVARLHRNRAVWENIWLKALARNTFHSKSEMKRIKVQRGEKVS